MCDLCCTAHRFSLNHKTKLQIRNSVITLWSYYTIWNYTDLTFPETVNLSDNPCTHSGFHFYIHVKQIQLFKRSTSFMNLNLRWGEALCCWIVCSDVFFFNGKKTKKTKYIHLTVPNTVRNCTDVNHTDKKGNSSWVLPLLFPYFHLWWMCFELRCYCSTYAVGDVKRECDIAIG